MIGDESELICAIKAYAATHGRFGVWDLDRDLTTKMSPDLLLAFNQAGRIDRYRLMIRRPKQYGLNAIVSFGKDEYVHQNVLIPDEWSALAEQTARGGKRCVQKLRRIAQVCEQLTGHCIDVNALVSEMTA